MDIKGRVITNKQISYFIFKLITLLVLSSSVLYSQNIKINEILYDPAGTDTGNEWIELYNDDSTIINLENWKIEKAGTYFSVCFTFPDISIASGEFLLIGESNVANADLTASLAFQNGGTATDGVRIISAEGDTIDTILYDFPNSNNLPGDANHPGIFFAPDVSSGYSLIRFPDGFDTDNCENDFFDCENSTPGEPNFMSQDLEICSVTIIPEHPDTLDEVYLYFEISNNSPIQIPPDSCRYDIFVEDTLFIEGIISDTIFAQTIITIVTILGNFDNGLYKITVQVYFSGDTQTSNNIVSISFLIGESPIIISEIMYKPSLPNIEWFEIYNRSERNFSLLNWHFKDTDDDWNSIETDRILPANTYAVISDDTLTIKNYYDDNILFFRTDDWPTSLSNVEDGLFIADMYYIILDTMFYYDSEITVPYNYSLERINPFDNVSNNWGVSIDSLGATPGRVNSITPKAYDLCVSSFTIEVEGNSISLSGICSNIGFNNIEDAEAIIFHDSNFNSQYDIGEEILIEDFSIPYEGLEEFSYNFEIVEDSYYLFGFLIISNLDLDTSNNLIFTTYNSPENYPLPINEIQYAPIDNEPEWLELYNNFSHPIDISGWKLADEGDTLNLASANPICEPGKYFILVEDDNDTLFILQKYFTIEPTITPRFIIGLPSLNNDEDLLLLLDEYGTVIDSIYYFSDWGKTQGNSLERIKPNVNSNNPDNWGVSIDSLGATPGRVNSITPKAYDLCASSFTIEANGNSISLSGICSNIGFNDIEDAEAIFFRDSNYNSQYDGGEEISIDDFSIPYEGFEEFSYTFQVVVDNYYLFGFLITSDLDLVTSNNLIFTTYNSPQNYPLPINEIQYAPIDNEPEWLELYNNFSHPIDISGWKLTDKRDTLNLWSANPICQLEEYIIIVADESDTLEILQKYSLMDSTYSVKFVVGLPILNNDEDILLLWDEYGTLIDSVYYFSDWGEISNNSLERINPNVNSNNPDNWESSINSNGATPGWENSLHIEMISPQVKLSINPNPVSLREKNSVLIEYNLPEALSKVNVRIFDMRGRMIRWLSDQEWLGSKGAIIWNCKDDNGRVVPIGIYIVYLEATGKQSGRIFRKTKTMVIGEK